MFGGILNQNCDTFVLGSSVTRAIIIASFGSALYTFDKITGQCLSQINLGHEANIMTMTYSSKDKILITIDQKGICKISIPNFEGAH